MLKSMITTLIVGLAIGLHILSLSAVEASPERQSETAIFDLRAEDITRLQVNNPSQTIILTRTLHGASWFREKTPLSPPDSQRITATLNALLSPKPISVIADENEVSKIPLVTTTLQVTLTARLDQSRVITQGLRVFELNPDKTAYYARKVAEPPENQVYLLPVDKVAIIIGLLASPPFQPSVSPSPTTAPTTVPTAVPTVAPTTPPPTATPTVAPTAVSPTVMPTATEFVGVPIVAPTIGPIPPTTTGPLAEIQDYLRAHPLRSLGASLACVLPVIILFVIFWWLARRRGKTGPTPPPPSPTGPYLEGITLPSFEFNLVKDRVTVGRALDRDLQITPDFVGWETVSRQHAHLEQRGERWIIVDGGEDGAPSTNGIFVNGKRTRENYLTEGFQVGFGEVLFSFHSQRTPSTLLQGVPQ